MAESISKSPSEGPPKGPHLSTLGVRKLLNTLILVGLGFMSTTCARPYTLPAEGTQIESPQIAIDQLRYQTGRVLLEVLHNCSAGDDMTSKANFEKSVAAFEPNLERFLKRITDLFPEKDARVLFQRIISQNYICRMGGDPKLHPGLTPSQIFIRFPQPGQRYTEIHISGDELDHGPAIHEIAHLMLWTTDDPKKPEHIINGPISEGKAELIAALIAPSSLFTPRYRDNISRMGSFGCRIGFKDLLHGMMYGFSAEEISTYGAMKDGAITDQQFQKFYADVLEFNPDAALVEFLKNAGKKQDRKPETSAVLSGSTGSMKFTKRQVVGPSPMLSDLVQN